MTYWQRFWLYIQLLPARIRGWPIWTWPNFLSLTRMIAVLPLWWLLDHGHDYIAVAVYIMALITDALDGYTARKFNQISDFGKLLDPLADKVLHIFLLQQFARMYPSIYPQYSLIWKLAVVLAVLPSFAYVLDKRRRLGSNIIGRVKFFLEAVGVGLLFFGWVHVSGVVLWLAIACAIGSILGHLFIKEGLDYRWWKKRENDK